MGKAGDRVVEVVSGANKKVDQKRKKAEADFRESLNRVASTEDGMVVINRLMNMCGFCLSSVVTQDGTVDKDAVSFNEGRRSVYLNIRSRIQKRYLKKIEFMKG